MASNNNGYESVPDVENGAAGAPASAASYADLPDNQAELMANFDNAAGLSSMGFEMPQADPNELMDQGKSMVMSLLQPTISAVGTFAVGYWMALQAQYSAAAALVVTAFPYINAIIQFASSIKPLQDKLMSAIEPIFAKKEKVEDDVAEGFQNITRKGTFCRRFDSGVTLSCQHQQRESILQSSTFHYLFSYCTMVAVTLW